MIYGNINVYSYYSILESLLSIDAIVEISIKKGLNYAFLTDKNLYGSIEFFTKCKKNNIKPILGLDFIFKNSNYIFIAKNYNGFKKLIKISSLIENQKEISFHDFDFNDLFIILKDGENILDNVNVLTQKDLYINNVKYYSSKDYRDYLVLRSIDKNETITNNKTFVSDEFSWKDADTINVNENQKNNFKKIIDECNLEFEDIEKNKLPLYNINKDSKNYLKELALEGLMEKLKINDNKMPKKYYDRLVYELNTINELGYNDYFLIVSDFVNFAKKNNIIIGPGRGSAAGSLVSYSLNITEIDPIKHNLIFERFLNKDRKTMPDIDIDVMDSRRDELIEYIFNKYGIKNCSQIITFQRIKYKMAIRDVGRVLNIPLNIIDFISKKIPTNLEKDFIDYVKNNNELSEFYKSYSELFEISQNLYNIPRQFSTHAAGILIANDDISNIIPTKKGSNNFLLSQWTMEYLEMFGLNKIDILGLKNLTIISDAIEMIKKNKNKKIVLSDIKLDDKDVFNEIKKGNTIGIFQLESDGMRSTLSKIQPENLEDISIVSALYRPGPQHMINKYVETRKDKSKISYLNEDFKQILESTNGFCIYQEQVIELIKIITSFSTAKADIFRRAISKKKIELFDAMKNDFFDAALKNKYDLKTIEKIYHLIIEFANYGFNHSHSIAYSLISYWMMYLKYYYPLEFMIALLNNDIGTNLKNNIYINEAKKNGINIYNIDIINSLSSFSIYNDGILLGFSSIKGFGCEIISKLLEIRKNNDFSQYENIISSLIKNDFSIKNIEILIKIGAFDKLIKNRNYLIINLQNIIKRNEAINPKTNKPIFDIEYVDADDFSELDKASFENQYLGYSFSNNENEIMFEKYEKEYNLFHFNNKSKPSVFNVLIQIKKIKKLFTKNNKEMSFIYIKDGDLDYSISCFSNKIYENLKLNQFYILKIREKNNKYDIVEIINDI